MRRLLVIVGIVAASGNATAQDTVKTPAECIAASERAIALRKDLHLVSARRESVSCAATSCPSEVREECARRATQITSALPTIVFDVRDGDGNDLVAVHLTVDGAPMTDAIDGAALTLDPGSHTFMFSARGAPPVTKTLVLREGEKDRHEAIVIGPQKARVSAPRDAALPTRSPLSRAAGFGLAGLGIVGIGVGAFFGVRASSAWSRSKDECATSSACTPTSHDLAVSDHDDAVQSATISTIAFITGGALLGGGAVWIVAAPVVTPKSASLGITARF